MDGNYQAMSEAMMTATAFYNSLLRLDYMSPDSYRELFKDGDAKEMFIRLANKLDHVRETYAK